MQRNLIETVMGAVVLIVAGLFVYFAASTAQVRALPGYPVTAAFLKIGGLSDGSDVRISGVKVGSVTATRLDTSTFDAVLTMNISNAVKLPADTVATIASEGPLGGKYVSLEPGTAKEIIPTGGSIAQTRSYKSLEDQVGEIIFLATSTSEGN